MSGILSANELRVARDLSGGVKISVGGSAGLLSPQQAIEFATVVLKLVGVDLVFSEQVKPPSARANFLAH